MALIEDNSLPPRHGLRELVTKRSGFKGKALSLTPCTALRETINTEMKAKERNLLDYW